LKNNKNLSAASSSSSSSELNLFWAWDQAELAGMR